MPIQWLEKRFNQVNKDLDKAVQESPVWRENDQILQSAPGVGTVLSITLLAVLPKLGRLNRLQIAALGQVLRRSVETAVHPAREANHLGWSC